MQSVDMTGKRILAFGAHPDDIEFGCGAVLLDAAAKGLRLIWSFFQKVRQVLTAIAPFERRRP